MNESIEFAEMLLCHSNVKFYIKTCMQTHNSLKYYMHILTVNCQVFFLVLLHQAQCANSGDNVTFFKKKKI